MGKTTPRKVKKSSEDPWKNQFKDLEKIHKDHHGDVIKEIEEKYNTLCDKIDQESTSHLPKLKPEVTEKSLQQKLYAVSLENFVGAKGFPMIDERSKAEIEDYFYENHENVLSVHFTNLVFVRFSDLESADRFFTLNYIRYRGRKITPFKLAEYFEENDQNTIENLKTELFRTSPTSDSDDSVSQNTDIV